MKYGMLIELQASTQTNPPDHNSVYLQAEIVQFFHIYTVNDGMLKCQEILFLC